MSDVNVSVCIFYSRVMVCLYKSEKKKVKSQMLLKDLGAAFSSAPLVTLCTESSGSLRIINVIDGQNKVWFGQRKKSKPITKSSSCLSTLFCKHQDEQIDYWEKLKQRWLLPFSPCCHVRTHVQRHVALILPDPMAFLSGRWHRMRIKICIQYDKVQYLSSNDYLNTKINNFTFSPFLLNAVIRFHVIIMR